jgi:hypothetical protein
MLFSNGTRSVTLTPTTVTNYTGTALFDPTINLILEITTPTPHGVFNLATVGYVVPSTINLSNSTTIAAGTTLVGFASPVSATVLQLRVAGYSGGVTMTNTVTGGSLGFGTTSPVPVADMIDLCNQVGADCWLQCPTSMTDSGMAGLAEYAATHLDSGLKLYGEFGNECWNYFLGSFVPCELLGYQLGLHGEGNNFQVGQVIRSQAYHQSLITAFTAVGRASDVVRILGTQGGNPGITTQVLPFCSTYGVTFDVLAPAVYFAPNHVVGTEPNFQAAYDLMTPYGTPQAGGNVDQTGGQATDWYELMMTYGEVSSLDVTSHRTILDNAGLSNVKIACYEGGPDVLTPSGSTVNGPFREHAVHWHPRAYQWMLGALQQLETAGVSRFMKYYASGSNLPNGNAVPNVTYDEWSGYWSWNMVAGTGTSADTINASNPQQVDQIASETGAAMRYWNALLTGSTSSSSGDNDMVQLDWPADWTVDSTFAPYSLVNGAAVSGLVTQTLKTLASISISASLTAVGANTANPSFDPRQIYIAFLRDIDGTNYETPPNLNDPDSPNPAQPLASSLPVGSGTIFNRVFNVSSEFGPGFRVWISSSLQTPVAITMRVKQA